MSNVSPFPPTISRLWEPIQQEVIWLHGRWIMYRQLYGTNEERISVLNKSAPTFFFYLEKALMDDVQLTLSKLADRYKSSNNLNLSLEAIEDAVKGVVWDIDYISQLEQAREIYVAACTIIKDRRNKRIAHNDLKYGLGENVTPLSGPSRAEIEQALKALRVFMHKVEFYFSNSRTSYENVKMFDDGDSLIVTLEKGLRYKELVKSGVVPNDDYTKSKKRDQ